MYNLKTCRTCIHFTRGWCSLRDVDVNPQCSCLHHTSLAQAMREEYEP